MKRTALIVVIAMISGMSAQNAAPKPKADVIFTHGNVYTGVADSSSLGAGKRSEAIAVRGDRILAVGMRDEVMKTKGPDTKIVDLDGHFVMPGFNDAHLHLASGGFAKLNVDEAMNSAGKFNIRGIPTLLVFKDGQVVEQIVGAVPKDQITKALERHIG